MPLMPQIKLTKVDVVGAMVARKGSRSRFDQTKEGPKAATLRPEGATQQNPVARSVVGVFLAETCARPVDQTDGGAVCAMAWMTHRSK
jgi:hypothetical protein